MTTLTNRTPRLRLAGYLAVAALGTALALTGCSSDTTPPDDAGTTASEEAPASEAPASEAPADDRPSKEEVVAGYNALIKEQMPSLPDDAIQTATTCIVDEIYDVVTTKTLEALAASDATAIDPADVTAFTDAQSACTASLNG